MPKRADPVSVFLLAELGDPRTLATPVWISEAGYEALTKWVRTEQPRGAFLMKLKRYAKNGFANYVGGSKPIQHEWNQVYRISDGASLMRLIGFFQSGANDFIVLDGYVKHGTELRAPERARIDRVSEIRAGGLWTKKQSN